MAMNDFEDGEVLYSTQLDNLTKNAMVTQGCNVIRQLEDRAITFSAGAMEGWGEAYIDADGRNDSVNLIENSASNGYVFDAADQSNALPLQSASGTTQGYYVPSSHTDISADTTNDVDSFTNPENAFDDDLTNYASKTGSASSSDISLGKTFGAQTVKKVRVVAGFGYDGGSYPHDVKIILQTYDGADWSDEATLADNSNTGNWESLVIDTVYDLDSSVQGIRVRLDAETSGNSEGFVAKVYYLNYGEITDSEISMTIPTGTYSDTISSAILVPKIEDWEASADIQYKLTGTAGAEDSGWLSCGVTPAVNTFTAFTAEPDTLIVKLIPKTTSPTAGYPSINGVFVRAE